MRKKQEHMLGVRVDEDLRARIEAAAERDRRPVSSWVKVVLLEYFQAVDDGRIAA